MTEKTPFANPSDLEKKMSGGIFGIIYDAPTFPMIPICGLSKAIF